jgi:hypothetical protein
VFLFFGAGCSVYWSSGHLSPVFDGGSQWQVVDLGFGPFFLLGLFLVTYSSALEVFAASGCVGFWVLVLDFGETPTSVGLSVGFYVGRHCLTMLVAVWGGGLMRRFVMVRCYCGDGLSWRPQLSRFELVT